MNIFINTCTCDAYFCSNDTEICWYHVKALINEAINLYIPNKVVRSHLRPRWFIPHLKHMLNKIYSLRKNTRCHRSASNKQKLSSAELLLREEIGAARKTFEANLINKFACDNNSGIYKCTSTLISSNSSPKSMLLESNTLDNDNDISNDFNKYFH